MDATKQIADALGRRISESDGAAITKFVYDGNQVVADTDATGGVMRTYAWGPGIDNLLSITVCTGAAPVTYYAVKDHLGTVHAWTDGSGAVVESYRFDAWGNVLGVFDSSNSPLATKHSPLGNRYLWQGREYDWHTGFYYFRARWYDPRTGRWLSNDPIGISGGLNQYVFCGNDPVNKKDSFGLTTSFTEGSYTFIKFSGDLYHDGPHWHVYARKGRSLLGRVSLDGKILTGSVPKTAMKMMLRKGIIQTAEKAGSLGIARGASALGIARGSSSLIGLTIGTIFYLATDAIAVGEEDPIIKEFPDGTTQITYFPDYGGWSYSVMINSDGTIQKPNKMSIYDEK